jgi:hypothetical protein
MQKSLPTTILILFFLFAGCENEPTVILEDTLHQEDELFKLIENVVTIGDDPIENEICVDFVYPLVIIKYDQYINPIQTITLFNDNQFGLLLNQLNPNQSISISYPIETTSVDGTVLSINNDEELKESLKSCEDDSIFTFCAGIVSTPETCINEIPYFEDELNNEYAGAVLFANPDYTVTLYHLNDYYVGTWTVLRVNNILHVNINLAGTSAVAQYWNHNYKVENYDLTNLTLTTPTQIRKIKKKCTDSTIFEVGDVGPTGGLIAFDKGEFSNGWRYIEVATNDLNMQEEWGCVASEIENAQFDSIGTGLQNTIAIANKHKNLSNYFTNPSACSTVNNGTVSAISALSEIIADKKDWFIPSIEELQVLYTNLHQNGTGNFSSGYYWSSSEGSTSDAKVVNFNTGESVLLAKNTPSVKTRLIRVF